MTDAMIMFGLSSIVGLISAIFWYWVQAIAKVQEQLASKYDVLKDELHGIKSDVFREYQSKDDAHKDAQMLMSMLKDIKNQLIKVNDKLDNKADK